MSSGRGSRERRPRQKDYTESAVTCQAALAQDDAHKEPEEEVEGPSCPFNHSGAAGSTALLQGLPVDSDSLGRSKGETDNKEVAPGSLGVVQGLPSGQVLHQR